MSIKADEEKCTGCGECIDTCPDEALKMENDKVKVVKDDCAECGACVDSCAVGALTLE